MSMHNKTDTMILLLSDARGVYIPRDFAQGFNLRRWHNVARYKKSLQSPDQDNYWDSWDMVLNNAHYIARPDEDMKAGRWTLHQDGDLWAVHESHVWEDAE